MGRFRDDERHDSVHRPANEQFEVQVGNKVLSCNVNMVVRHTGEARTVKEGWIGLSDSEDGDENKSIM